MKIRNKREYQNQGLAEWKVEIRLTGSEHR